MELIHDYICSEKVPHNMSGVQLKTIVTRVLAKRRMVYYLFRKFDSKEKILLKHLGTVQAFRDSGLNGSSCTWLAPLPEYLQDVAKFSAKLLRGQKELDKLLDEVLDADAFATAEACVWSNQS